MAKKFKIAGGHRDTVCSSQNILKSGGNAFDAAISGVFSSMVCEYLYTGVASGGAMLVKKNGLYPSLIDFFVETPASIKKSVKDFKTIYADFGDTKQEFNIGAGSVGVPGTIPGLIEIHRQYGSLPFSVLSLSFRRKKLLRITLRTRDPFNLHSWCYWQLAMHRFTGD